DSFFRLASMAFESHTPYHNAQPLRGYPMRILQLLALTAICFLSLTAFAATPIQVSGSITTSDGVRIHYLELGKGDPIVLIPGWTLPADIWSGVMNSLQDRYRVIAVDPRSQGDSDKPSDGNYPERRARDYKELVDALKLKRPLLVGWSMAVPELLSYVDQFGVQNVRGVVLVDGFVKIDPAIASQLSIFFKQFASKRKEMTEGFVRSMFKNPPSEDEVAHLSASVLKTPTNSAMALMFAMLGTVDSTSGLAKLTGTPVLFEHTAQLQAQADIVQKALPSAKIHKYDTAHALFADGPDATKE